jgi:hypothetical protein
MALMDGNRAGGAKIHFRGRGRADVGAIEVSMREYILVTPFSTAAIVLGLGWLLGRPHQPF